MPECKDTCDSETTNKDNTNNTYNKKSDRVILYAHGKTYDVTDFVNKHPAGSRCILKKNETDCTIDYDFHSSHARKMWKDYTVDSNKAESRCIVM